MNKVLTFNSNSLKCVINDVNDYCAFWIYTKHEMIKFINSEYYQLKKYMSYGIRESQGLGFTFYYKNIVIDEDNC